jgi:hypothetical protein
VFAPAVTVNAAPEVPEVRLTDSQDGRDSTDHDAWVVVTVVETEPPAASKRPEFGDKVNGSGAAAHNTVNTQLLLPVETTTLPVCCEVSGFCEADAVNTCPLAPDVRLTDSHDEYD